MVGAAIIAAPATPTPMRADLTGLALTLSLIVENRPASALVTNDVRSITTAKVVARDFNKLRYNLIWIPPSIE
ncbi:MAG: hypothetical protein BWY82_00092 [Verrucomicrobia bacterium ADurb.Bin474]|nr:MAG: hypothetical protein BWY82_00092 [Verrucomicrobia bacterium ADurb.Bin474]